MRKILILMLLGSLLWGCARPDDPASLSTSVPTGISGQVTDAQGRAVADAWVYAYRNTSTGMRGPADFGGQTDPSGRYFLDLVEGRYYLIARWRRTGGEAGPPRAGDAWALFHANPVRVEPGRLAKADFVLQGVQPGQPVLLRSGSLSQGKTGFSGRLIDAGSGRPLVGAFALAYSDTDFRRMPDYTSAVVGSDGRFQLFLPPGERYCLGARTRTRGQPIAGEPYGLLGDGEAGCREAVKGRLIEVGDIQLRPYQR